MKIVGLKKVLIFVKKNVEKNTCPKINFILIWKGIFSGLNGIRLDIWLVRSSKDFEKKFIKESSYFGYLFVF